MPRDVLIIDNKVSRNVRGVVGITMNEYKDVLMSLIVATAEYNGLPLTELVRVSQNVIDDIETKLYKEKGELKINGSYNFCKEENNTGR